MTIYHFSIEQILPLIVGGIIVVSSMVCFQLNKTKTSLYLLFFGALSLGYFMAHLDPFLILWDEQYHALVAKNLINHPFKPLLYSNPLLEYDYRNWTENHVWLHKQPLFLWQIALSLKWFGTTALAVRLPSVLLHAILPILIYRIGSIVYTEKVGYYGGLFFALAYFPLELVAGRYSTDHNDVAFLFYVTASFWAWFEYQHSKNKAWLILIGLFSGCAVLVKWLVGLLIYAIWIISIGVNDNKDWIKIKNYFPLTISFGISLLIFIPWQIYIHQAFPNEADYELTLNSAHFFYSIENHGGDNWFHFKALKTLYGSGVIIPYLYLLGLIVLIKKVTSRTYQVAIGLAVIIIYGFYSLADTKMVSFCIIASPFAFLGLAALVAETFSFLNKKIVSKSFHLLFQPLILLIIGAFLINLPKIANYHTVWKPKDNFNRIAELKQMALIEKLTQQLKSDKSVIFNTNTRLNGHISIMFYTNFIAYNFIPSTEQLNSVKEQGYQPVIINNYHLPSYLKNDTSVIIINP